MSEKFLHHCHRTFTDHDMEPPWGRLVQQTRVAHHDEALLLGHVKLEIGLHTDDMLAKLAAVET
eukprot:CAMPEP_0117578696 /NCGR_PEP_ID=MMETSP0784-20121206/64170_1 /TAXON_ID=39447 /ORGANISM="" /LENGTH=63 /DNA_ID=CAMNT_0005378435 /DNA_START=406 /DNA_END=594 /DNA_ORIENTATION=+